MARRLPRLQCLVLAAYAGRCQQLVPLLSDLAGQLRELLQAAQQRCGDGRQQPLLGALSPFKQGGSSKRRQLPGPTIRAQQTRGAVHIRVGLHARRGGCGARASPLALCVCAAGAPQEDAVGPVVASLADACGRMRQELQTAIDTKCTQACAGGALTHGVHCCSVA